MTTGLKVIEHAGQRVRHGFDLDTDARWTWRQCSAGDEIEFRITNTSSTAVTHGLAYVDFGWSFP